MINFDSSEASLTKGCFAFKPSKSRKKKYTNSSCDSNYHQKEFVQLWSEIESKILAIESSSYKKTFDAVVKFIKSCIKNSINQVDEIPAAVLQMGVNMPDHSNIFKCLEEILRSQGNYTALLESRKCYNFSSTLQIIDSELQNQLTKDEVLSPKKRPRASDQKKLRPLILLIQDVETFNVDLLEEIILNCKLYLGKLPIVLIFGMSSAMVTLQNILPQRALCHLGIETFHSFAATEYLTRIIEEVVMSPEQPFKLGPKVFRLIVDTVLYHDFSVTNLSHLLQFSLMQHFYHNKGTSLCCPESEIEKKIHNMKNEDLQFLKRLPSLEQYKENNPDILSSISNPSAFKTLLIKLIRNLFQYQNTMMISLRVLYHLVKDLPGNPLGKQFREMYSINLEKQISLTKGFKEAEKLLKMQSQNELVSKFKTCLELLKSCDHSIAKDLVELIENSASQMSNLTSDDFEKTLEKPFNPGSETFTNRFELQEKMRSSIKMKRSRFEAVRSETVDKILEYFKDISSPMLLPMHEIFFFDDVSALKKHLMPTPRVVFCYALSNPQQYLQCKCCKITDPDEIQACMPDLCVLYKLHLECGKLINLCDWLEAFKAIKSKENQSRQKRGTSIVRFDDSKLNIRFLHAATELQLLGFIKPTKRKTDHVARLTFGTF